MTTVMVFDLDSTIADGSHRDHLLKEFCVQCGGAAYLATFKGSSEKVCASCDCDTFHIPVSSWRAFTMPSALEFDSPTPAAQQLIKKAQSCGVDIHFITGRQKEAREVTEAWLTKHFGFDKDKNILLMRDTDSYVRSDVPHVPASVHKERSLNTLKLLKSYTSNDLFFFFEDDLHALNMYSNHGIALKAPDCWNVINPLLNLATEKLFSK